MFEILIGIVFIAIAIVVSLAVWKVLGILLYRSDYLEICKYEKEFRKAKNDKFEILRVKIFNKFHEATLEEIKDVETKIAIEVEEINRVNTIYSMSALVTSIIGVFWGKDGIFPVISKIIDQDFYYLSSFIFEIYVFLPVIILALYFILSMKTRRYIKYYVFIKELVSRYKETNEYKEKLNSSL